MSWLPSFFRVSNAWIFALMIPIIILYFLKMRRSRIDISSLALWRQVINDQRVNAPFQKFKRNFLLLLQLLLLALIALAAMQPFWGGDSERADYLPILIDCSASMGARDAEGETRLDVAKKEIQKIIDGMLPDQKLTFIAIGSTTRRVCEFSDNKAVLSEALDSIVVHDVSAKLPDGLRLAQALSRTETIERVRLYSDGNFPTKLNPATNKPMAEIDFDLPFTVDFFQIDPVTENVGITAMNARRSTPEKWDAFVRVEGAEATSSEVDVLMRANGVEIGQERVILDAGESQRLVFSLDATVEQNLEVLLKPVSGDAIRADNQAWLKLPRGRELDVYCPNELSSFRHAISSLEGIAIEPADDGTSVSAKYDLLISNDLADAEKGANVSIFVGKVPTDLEDILTIEEAGSEVVDWKRDAQLLQHVQLKEVLIGQQPKKGKGFEDTDIEQRGYEILAFGKTGPLILKRRIGIQFEYYFLFDTDVSTFPYRVGFPVMCSNIVEEAMQVTALSDLRAPSTGVLPEIHVGKGASVRVSDPFGKHQQFEANEAGVLIGVPAPVVGEYEIRADGELVETVGVSMLNSNETSLATVDTLHFNELSVDAAEGLVDTDQPLWSYLAFAALFVLLFEWWYFQRKPIGIPD